jgi:hypothetical protein
MAVSRPSPGQRRRLPAAVSERMTRWLRRYVRPPALREPGHSSTPLTFVCSTAADLVKSNQCGHHRQQPGLFHLEARPRCRAPQCSNASTAAAGRTLDLAKPCWGGALCQPVAAINQRTMESTEEGSAVRFAQ